MIRTVEFTGRLDVFPTAALLQWAGTERRTGALVVRSEGREKQLLFQVGRLVGCLSSDPREHFGQYLLLHGHLEPPALVEALGHCRQHGRRLGASLAELGMLPEATIRRTLREAIEASVCDLFLWKHGLFYFVERTLPVEQLTSEPIEMMHLVLEGTRWIDEQARLRAILVSDQVVLSRGAAFATEDLAPVARQIVRALSSLGREATVGELRDRTGGVEFLVLQEIVALLRADVLRISRVVEATARPAVSEVNLQRLLLEQTAIEEVMVGGEKAVVPLDFLRPLCPVWLRRPSGDDLAGHSAAQRVLLEGLDGRTPLRRLLAPGESQRAEQIEALLMAVKRREVVLLPASIEEVERRLDAESPLRRIWKKLAS
jgi:hypothetical protein